MRNEVADHTPAGQTLTVFVTSLTLLLKYLIYTYIHTGMYSCWVKTYWLHLELWIPTLTWDIHGCVLKAILTLFYRDFRLVPMALWWMTSLVGFLQSQTLAWRVGRPSIPFFQSVHCPTWWLAESASTCQFYLLMFSAVSTTSSHLTKNLYTCAKKGVISFAFLPAIHQSSIADMGSNHIVVQ